MNQVVIGSLILSLLHAIIPNHWLPVLAIGRREKWTLAKVMEVTFISGLSHAVSTVLIGVILAFLGLKLNETIDQFTHWAAPCILILIGFFFIYQHYRHKHFHLHHTPEGGRPSVKIIIALVAAMFLSPCMEIEAYFLMAGAISWQLVTLIAIMYTVITISGMLLWVRLAYNGVLKLNWHKWEHNAGIITGLILVATGIISFFIS